MTETSDSELTYDTNDFEYSFIPGVYNIGNFKEEDENDSEPKKLLEQCSNRQSAHIAMSL